MSEDKIQKAMDTISDFYFGESEDSGEAMFQHFAQKHHEKFQKDQDVIMDEHKLEYTEAYKEFQQLFEEKIEQLIINAGVSQEEFVEAIKERSKTDPEVKMFLDILISVSDYTTFVEMMVDYVDKKEFE